MTTLIDEYEMYASGKLCPAIPHYPRIAKVLAACTWRPNLEQLARVLVAQLKREDIKKVTIKAYTKHFTDAYKIITTIRRYRMGWRYSTEAPTPEQRLIDRLYNPHTKQLKTAVTGGREHTNIRFHRGEPNVRYHSISGGHGRSFWEDFYLDITVPKGWSYLARADKHIIPAHEGQLIQLIVDYKNVEQGDLFRGEEWQPTWELAEVRVLKRKSGTRTLSDPFIMGRCGSVVATTKEVTAMYSALPKAICKAVTARLS